MSREILSITDPKDAFCLMLLERIDKLEDQVYTLSKQLNEVNDDRNDIFLKSKDILNNNECVGAMKLAVYCFSMTLQEAKETMEDCMKLLVGRFGIDNFKSLSGAIIIDDFEKGVFKCCTRICMNFTTPCWIHEFTRALNKIPLPVRVDTIVDKGSILYYKFSNDSGYGSDDDNRYGGIVYSYFDLDCKRIDEPSWKEWHNDCLLITEPPYDFSDDGWQSEGSFDSDSTI
jgi:hypothetical protein